MNVKVIRKDDVPNCCFFKCGYNTYNLPSLNAFYCVHTHLYLYFNLPSSPPTTFTSLSKSPAQYSLTCNKNLCIMTYLIRCAYRHHRPRRRKPCHTHRMHKNKYPKWVPQCLSLIVINLLMGWVKAEARIQYKILQQIFSQWIQFTAATVKVKNGRVPGILR